MTTRLSLLLLLAASASLSLGRPFTATDLNGMERLSDLATCPGSTLFVVSSTLWDPAADKKTTNLYLGDWNSSSYTPLQRLAPKDFVHDSNPMFLPGCRLLMFVSDRPGPYSGTQLWAVEMSSPGSAYQVSTFPVDVESARLSPSGSQVAVSARVYPGTTMSQTAQRDQEIQKRRYNVQTFTTLFVRRWAEWWDGKMVHLHVGPVKRDQYGRAVMGDVVDVMGSMDGDCPSRPFGGVEEFDWSPDERELAFTTQIGGNQRALTTDLNVYLYDLTSRSRRCITCANKAVDTAPAYSPDGRYLAYLSMTHPGEESDRKRVMLYDRSSGFAREVTPNWDRSPDSLFWSTSGSSTLYAVVEDAMRNVVVTIDVPSGAVYWTVRGDPYSMGGARVVASPAGSDCLVYLRHDYHHPHEVFASCPGGEQSRVTGVNDARLAGIEFTEYTEVTWPGANPGDIVHGWLVKPYGWNPSGRFPLVLYVHGGPEGAWNTEWHYRWNPQAISAAGYALLMPNIRGSFGFGTNWSRGVLGQWGGLPFQDLMAGLSHVVKNYPWIDGSRVGAMGASYGGYMMNWLNAQTSPQKLLRCIVCHDGVFDAAANFWTTDELYFTTAEFLGTPNTPGNVYAKWSPSTYADQMTTPMMIIHGGMDFRLPDVQAIAMFNNLQRLGTPSVFLRFPRATHFILNPNDSLHWHSQVISWLDQWLKK